MEATPHGMPHMYIGYSMATMNSPDDPIFWLHHCNIDRLWHLWMDCNGYDKVTPDLLTNDQYEAANPVSAAYPSKNPYTGAVYCVGIDDQIPYAWDKPGSDSLIFPLAKWPSPRNLWSCGTDGKPGHDGIFYRYGTDQLVRAFSQSCVDAKSWTLVDVGYVFTRVKKTQKRDEKLHPLMRDLVDTYEAKLDEGKSHKEVILEMAMSECERAPKNDIDEQLMMWIKMANHVPEDYDSLCDKPSRRLQNQVSTNDAIPSLQSGTTVPLWVILVASISSGLVVVAIITVIMIFVRRKSDMNTDGYREMDQ